MKITQELINKLSDENITRKEYNAIVNAINEKVDEIWKSIIEISGRKLEWWAFSNDVSYGHGNGSSGGNFDPDLYKEWIDIDGDSTDHKLCDYLYNQGFPTEFLWTDYKSVVKSHILDLENKKLERAARKEAALKKKEMMVESIKNKLTADELAIIKFK